MSGGSKNWVGFAGLAGGSTNSFHISLLFFTSSFLNLRFFSKSEIFTCCETQKYYIILISPIVNQSLIFGKKLDAPSFLLTHATVFKCKTLEETQILSSTNFTVVIDKTVNSARIYSKNIDAQMHFFHRFLLGITEIIFDRSFFPGQSCAGIVMSRCTLG